ncbi:RHOMBOID-like protein 9, chloroplastic isoform X2 [Macadamia integrifolia]|uniref:RHOMBOID-like protein 9, chloroplastic isoform X2 n=1 Tax=Macadamia integrifolia TaxID=60698 RepID=UPI001C52BFAC|nr:RHOMBOID-like protein 9, chloroplastic isoform X2 [Macadamia integrifolia]
MAVVTLCSKIFYKDRVLPTPKVIKDDKAVIGESVANQEVCRCFSSVSGDAGSRLHSIYYVNDFCMKAKARLGGDNTSYMVDVRRFMQLQTSIKPSALHRAYNMESDPTSARQNGSQKGKLHDLSYPSESSNSGSHLKMLDSYFSKLQHEKSQQQTTSMCSSDFDAVVQENNKIDPVSKLPDNMESHGKNDHFNAEKELGSLDIYIRKLNREVNSQKNSTSSPDGEANERNLLGSKDDWSNPENSQGLLQYDETSDLYLIGILASINIAVYIFEIASPVRYSDVELLSLPLLYGAKINQLILVGEWWRLVTPMFLHSGFLHVALGCWVLLTFGPQVCRGYGSFTFFLIYVLGGISGNVTSFMHTPELTVGGTGPAFAMIGAWMIYRIQNKYAIAKEGTEIMFQKAVIATALSFVLSNFGPIDDWTHFGATCAGIAYGFFTCPTLQLDEASSKGGQEEGITLVRRYANPCKSVIIFIIFIVVLSSLIFVFEPPLDTVEADSLV